MRLLRSAVVAAAALVGQFAQAPGPTTLSGGTAAISGVVVDAVTKRPIEFATVSIRLRDLSRTVMTDDLGRYVFMELPAAANYVLRATKPGFFNNNGVSSTDPARGLITLADGQWLSDVVVPLHRPASISGTVTDERGRPVVLAWVRVCARVFIGGRPQLAGGLVTKTDDRGRYRLFGLEAGIYVVLVPSVEQTILRGPSIETAALADASYLVAPPIDGQPRTYLATFYPSTRSWTEATSVDLGMSEERDGIDIQLRPERAFRVSGVIDGPREALANMTLRLMFTGNEALGPGGESATTSVSPSGEFVFLNVPDGGYTIQAMPTITELTTGTSGFISEFTTTISRLPWTPGAGLRYGLTDGIGSTPETTGVQVFGVGPKREVGPLWAHVPLAINGADVEHVRVPLEKTASLSGRVVLDGQSRSPVSIRAEPAGGNIELGMPNSIVAASSQDFRIDGLFGGAYRLSLTILGPYAVRAITAEGLDHTNEPFDMTSGKSVDYVVVTLTDQIPKITGTVRDGRGETRSDAAVVFFPADAHWWTTFGVTPARLGSLPVGKDGSYSTSGSRLFGGAMPAGEYFLIAVPSSLRYAWNDPRFLESASRLATRLSVGWGETRTQDLVFRDAATLQGR